MRKFKTTQAFISSFSSNPLRNGSVETEGFYEAGDGGGGVWMYTGVTNLTPSRTPSQLGSPFLHDASGNKWSADRSKPLTLASLGGVGSADDTLAIFAWLTAAGDLYAGDGTYTVAAAGANAGGVLVDLVKNTKVTCSPNAIFKAGQDLDNDIIRLEVPNGPQANQVTVEWIGGTIDLRLQRNSTSVPFSTNYPPANLGSSATTDGLSIIGIYDNGGAKQGVSKCTVHGTTFIATDNTWESAGGDSGLNTASGDDTVYNCRFIGCRDLGIYHSSDSFNDSGLGLGNTLKVFGNTFEKCMFGVSSKRGADNGGIYGNVFIDCIEAISNAPFDKRSVCFSITGNTINGYIFGIDVNSNDGVAISNNVIINAGLLLEDGTVPTANFTNPQAITLRGVIDGTVTANVISGKIPEFSALSCEGIVFEAQDTGAGLIASDDNLVMSNIIKNIDAPFTSSDFLNNSIALNKVAGTNDNSWNMAIRNLVQRSGGELTIAGGVITINSSYHNVDTEASAASDDLDTINGGTDGQRLILKANASTRTVVIKDTSGNIQIAGDFSLTNQADFIELIYDVGTSFWYELSRSDNGA